MQSDDEQEYAVKDLGNPKNPTHALCPACGEIKPIKNFRTKSTYIQARSWGYRNCIEITHEKCVLCRKPPKKVKDLTLKEIRNKVLSGDIKGGAIGALAIKNKEDEIRRKKREAVERRWRSARAKEWQKLMTDSTPEYTRVRKQVSIVPYTKQQLTAFFTLYREALVNVRAMFSLEKKSGRTVPLKGQAWWLYIPTLKREELISAWEAVPFNHRQNLKIPPLMKGRRDEHG